MKNVLIGLVIGLSIICVAMVRYPVGQPVPPEVYTAVMVDPNNDMIYQRMPLAPEQWTKAFGDNERTRLFFTVDQIIVAVSGLNARVEALENTVVGPNEPSGPKSFRAVIADPNEAK